MKQRRNRHRTADRLRAVLRNAGWLLGGKGIGAVLSLVYLGLATRSLGPTGFGSFALILGTAQAVVGLVTFQSWQIVVRFGVGHMHSGDLDRLYRVQRFCLALDAASALIGAAVAAGVVQLLGWHFDWTGALERDATIFCFILLASISSTPAGILRLHDRFEIAATAETVTPVMRMLGALVVVVLDGGVAGFLVAWAVADLTAAAFTWIAAVRVGGFALRAGGGVVAENPGIKHFALLTNAASSLNALSRQAPVLIVGWLAGPAAAGGYRIAFQLSQALTKLSGTLQRAVFPELMRTRAEAAMKDVFKLFRHTTRFAALAGVVIMIFIAVLGKPALHLVAGAEYVAVYPLLLLLGGAAVIDLIAVSFEPALFAAGRAGTAFRMRLVPVAILLGLPFLLVPRMGSAGAAAAALAASIISFVLLGAAAWRVLRQPRRRGSFSQRPESIDPDV